MRNVWLALLCGALLAAGPAAGVLAPMALPVLAAAPPRENRDEWQQPDRVLADLALKPGQTVADVGAGSGYFTFRLAKAVGDAGKAIATEIAEKALKAVSDRAAKENVRTVETLLGEPTDTKLAPASVDAVLVCDVLHHVPVAQRLALMQNVVRALKPGALLSIIDWRVDATISHDRDRRIPREDLVKLAQDAGLVFDAEFHYLKHQVFLRFRKPPAAP